MTSILIFSNVFAATLPTTSSFAILSGEKIKVVDSDFIKADKGFTYGQQKAGCVDTYSIKDIEALLNKPQDLSRLSIADIEARTRLLTKVGAYHAHVEHSYDLAIKRLLLANNMLTDKKEKAWNCLHLAYCYERKFAQSKMENDKLQAMDYINKAFSSLDKTDKKEMAFVFCLKGCIAKSEDDPWTANWNFDKAMTIYKRIESNSVNTFMMIQNLFKSKNNTIFIDDRLNLMPVCKASDMEAAYCMHS